MKVVKVIDIIYYTLAKDIRIIMITMEWWKELIFSQSDEPLRSIYYI